MKFNQAKAGLFLLLVVFSILLLPGTSHAAVNEQDYVVSNLEVNDIPEDDGSGLVISWKPLPKERRIIEYRVYRGATPDSMFYIGRIDVNVKTGVSGDVMYYYDSDYNYFSDFSAPGKLKRERRAPKGSPLYTGYPRDPNVTGPELSNYDLLAVISEKELYYKSEKVEITNEDGDVDVYAGLHMRNYTQLVKKLIPNKGYYYTVVAVNEARKFFPHAEAAMGYPRKNGPESPREFYPVYVQDQNKIQLEWSLPGSSDIDSYDTYIMNKSDLPAFNDYLAEQNEIEKNEIANLDDEAIELLTPTKENPAVLAYSSPWTVYTDLKTGVIEITEGQVGGLDFNMDTVSDYVMVFAYQGPKYANFTEAKEIEVINSSMLPTFANLSDENPFTVTDRKSDKGDYNTIKWGKPVVYLTNSSYANAKKSKLLLNYEISNNVDYKIKNIYFTIYDEAGKEIDKINEYYQDNKFLVNLPEGVNPESSLMVKMTIKANKDLGDYELTQELTFDEISRSLSPKDVYLGDEDLKSYGYYVYRRNYAGSTYRLSKKAAGTQRELQDNIRHTVTVFQGLTDYDKEKGLYLGSTIYGASLTDDKEDQLLGFVYRSAYENFMANMEKSVIEYKALADTATAEEVKLQANEAVESTQKRIDFISNHPVTKEALATKNDKAFAKVFGDYRNSRSRHFEYMIIKSDGKGHFIEIPVYVDAEGNQYFMPKSNLMKREMIPAMIAALFFGFLVFLMINKAKRGHDLYVRPIAGIEEVDNAIGRATEMGRPILFVPGLSGISDVATLAGLAILGRVAKKAAEYDTKILVPVRDYIVLPIAQETVKEAHYEAGRPDTFDKNSVFFITTTQFAFVAGVNGIMIREKTATNFYMGMFWAEALLMTETGNSTGAIQIAGTDAITQIPFFITTCDYTLIGEELYAASAYLAREPLQLGTLKAVDYFKFVVICFIVGGALLSSMHLTFLINAFPKK